LVNVKLEECLNAGVEFVEGFRLEDDVDEFVYEVFLSDGFNDKPVSEPDSVRVAYAQLPSDSCQCEAFAYLP